MNYDRSERAVETLLRICDLLTYLPLASARGSNIQPLLLAKMSTVPVPGLDM